MKYSEIRQTLAFSEFSYFNEHQILFPTTELGLFRSLLPIEELVLQFSKTKCFKKLGRKEIFSLETQICLLFLKSKYDMSDKKLIERLNSDISFQLFCNVYIPPLNPVVDFKIVSRIRSKLSALLNIEEFQKIIASALKPHISNHDLSIVMSDATCYESNLRFPTDQKLLWESIEVVFGVIRANVTRLPRTKYTTVKRAYKSFSKSRRRSFKTRRMITRKLLNLVNKLLNVYDNLAKSNYIDCSLTDLKYINIIKNIYQQQYDLFQGKSVTNRLLSISKPYVRPIVRGKESKAVEFGAKVNAIQVGGFNFIEHLNYNAFHEGIRVPECILLHETLFNIKPCFFAGDAIYATNKNRTYLKDNNITTNFVPKGRLSKDEKDKKITRRELNISRSTVLEGRFGTEKEHYSLRKIKARTKKNEILWIVFGIHAANFSSLARKKYTEQKEKVVIAA